MELEASSDGLSITGHRPAGRRIARILRKAVESAARLCRAYLPVLNGRYDDEIGRRHFCASCSVRRSYPRPATNCDLHPRHYRCRRSVWVRQAERRRGWPIFAGGEGESCPAEAQSCRRQYLRHGKPCELHAWRSTARDSTIGRHDAADEHESPIGRRQNRVPKGLRGMQLQCQGVTTG